MLQTQTVIPELLELLRKLMNEKLFDNYFLVGGTALSLQIGHRNSIDIDMFGIAKLTKIYLFRN
jgi:predicted nucleotidyltransferase component of viral defense system